MTLTVERTYLTRSTALSARLVEPDLFPVDGLLVEGSQDLDTPRPDDESIVAHARDLAARYPTSAVAWARLAQAELTSGNRLSAVEAASRAIELAGEGDRGAVAAGIKVLTALGDRERATELLASTSAAPSVVSGLLAARQDQLERAEHILAGRDDPLSLAVRGWLRLEEGRMFKRLILRLIHSLATTMFTFLEVAGIPRVKDEESKRGGG